MPSKRCVICAENFNSGLYTRERVGMRKVHAIDKCLDECYAQVEHKRQGKRKADNALTDALNTLYQARAHARKIGYRGPSYR